MLFLVVFEHKIRCQHFKKIGLSVYHSCSVVPSLFIALVINSYYEIFDPRNKVQFCLWGIDVKRLNGFINVEDILLE